MSANVIPVCDIRGFSGNVLSVSDSSAASAAITGSRIHVSVDAAMFVQVGEDPTAVVDTSFRLFPGAVFSIPIVSGDKIAAIMASGTGNLYWHVVK